MQEKRSETTEDFKARIAALSGPKPIEDKPTVRKPSDRGYYPPTREVLSGGLDPRLGPDFVETTLLRMGSRVKCGNGFAPAFKGQRGTISEVKTVRGELLFVITFDTPTPAATNWEPLKTLAATADCYELLPPASFPSLSRSAEDQRRMGGAA